jgi:fructose-bisphosphate aldolase class II
VRLAWRRGFDQGLSDHPEEIVPYKLLPQVVDSVKEVAAARLALFSGKEPQPRSAAR